MRETNLFRELLLISIGHKNSFSSVPSSEDWQGLFAAYRKQALLGICFEGIQTVFKSHPSGGSKNAVDWYCCDDSGTQSAYGPALFKIAADFDFGRI